MKSTANYRRILTSISLILASGLMIVSTVLQPGFVEPAGQLAAIAAAGTPATISALGFAFAPLPFIIAMLGVSQLLSTRSPILSNLAATLGIVGGFGHAIHAGTTLVVLTMAADSANHQTYNQLLAVHETGPAIPFMVMGLLGTVLGILFLAIGLGRAHVGPGWVPWVLGAFLLIEFVGSNFTEWAAPAAGVLYVVAFCTLAVVVWKSPAAAWASASDTRFREEVVA